MDLFDPLYAMDLYVDQNNYDPQYVPQSLVYTPNVQAAISNLHGANSTAAAAAAAATATAAASGGFYPQTATPVGTAVAVASGDANHHLHSQQQPPQQQLLDHHQQSYLQQQQQSQPPHHHPHPHGPTSGSLQFEHQQPGPHPSSSSSSLLLQAQGQPSSGPPSVQSQPYTQYSAASYHAPFYRGASSVGGASATASTPSGSIVGHAAYPPTSAGAGAAAAPGGVAAASQIGQIGGLINNGLFVAGSANGAAAAAVGANGFSPSSIPLIGAGGPGGAYSTSEGLYTSSAYEVVPGYHHISEDSMAGGAAHGAHGGASAGNHISPSMSEPSPRQRKNGFGLPTTTSSSISSSSSGNGYGQRKGSLGGSGTSSRRLSRTSVVEQLRRKPLLYQKACVNANSKKGLIQCSHCKTSYTNLLEFAQHLDEFEHRRSHLCPVEDCPWSVIGLQRKAELRRHCVSQHFLKGKLKEQSNQNLDTDTKQQMVKLLYSCNKENCGKHFYRKDSLQRHQRLVHQNKDSKFNRKWNKKPRFEGMGEDGVMADME